ncbi:flagellar motor switch protein FliN/FliY [Okibacterium sp. HSC-33S16]|uniref:flagellar motor switch protein FliN n=1 Tax=Okibacterium sp. HSC-33S16 TaxID=2910965 RepID=UPI0020A09483|nr:flagellar motor switch protein FliN [Okibacterium sp. HSC-33S16]MCP2032938.1 flagellar motor switch protein FliN/FliY [Okibacterium sp. HSC-33S16]
MTITQTQLRSAADAAAALLPTMPALRAIQGYDRESIGDHARSATVATLVGAPSADFALILVDPDALTVAAGSDSPLISALDIVRPALDAASAAFGAGVLGESRREDASALFADEDTVVFALAGDAGTAGWFAIRVREHGTLGASAAPTTTAVGKLNRINNVEMALTVEIGRTRMSVRDVLALEPGGIIELDRSAGAPADVLLNGRLIAHGEVVVVDQDYAVRITQILDVADGQL